MLTEKVYNDQTEPEYLIKAIIKRKIMFSNRPTPLRNAMRGDDSQPLSKQRKVN